ncbi:MAG: aldo/keto reductase [Candidatus Omnitrophica bacterium]|nr:aldo/keto reductase [Candidatus Omnitrophota bacterium]
MELTHYVTLGRSGLRVSPLCLGAMTFGEDWGWGANPEDSCRIIDAYMDAGGNFIDTANIYTKGHSEKIIGDHLGKHRHKRDRTVIATKFMGNMYSGDPNGGGAGRKSIIAACEQSLRRLQTDYIDLYWMHFWDNLTPMEETLLALNDLVQSGKVRYLGFSDTPAWKCAQAQTLIDFRGWSRLVALQIEYSLVERTVEGELAPMALEMGLGITPWSPLKGGVLTGKYTRENKDDIDPGRGEGIKKNLTEETFKILDILKEIARQTDSSPAEVSLAWLREKPGVTSIILGARTLDQLKSNLSSLSVELDSDQMKRLDEASEPTLNFPHDFLKFAMNVARSGCHIDGDQYEAWPMSPENDDERW